MSVETADIVVLSFMRYENMVLEYQTERFFSASLCYSGVRLIITRVLVRR